MAREKVSAGLLMYRRRGGALEVLLVKPGGPFWRNKDEGAWTIPKGGAEEDESLFEAALREFREETGFEPTGPYVELSPIRQKGGKRVHAWAFEGEVDPGELESAVFEMTWPPRSGRVQAFPEVEAARWFTPAEAKEKINPAQAAWLEELAERVDAGA